MSVVTCFVTGATDGIGFATARALGALGWRVLVHGRSLQKAERASSALAEAGGVFVPVWGDFERFDEVRALAAHVLEKTDGVLDVLVNNAGIFATARRETADGNEATLQVNHLSPFLLTLKLRPALEAAPQGRVVNVSSIAHTSGRVNLDDLQSTRRYDGFGVYALSKLLNLHFTHELARRLSGTRVTANALHPGVISTKLLRLAFSMEGASVESGAETSVMCASHPALAHTTGRYFVNSAERACASHAHDASLEARLWDESVRLTSAT